MAVDLRYQTVAARIMATILDGLILMVPSLAVGFVFGVLGSPENPLLNVFGLIISTTYLTLFWSLRGWTPGMKVTGIRIMDVSETRGLSLFQAFLRHSVVVGSTLLFLAVNGSFMAAGVSETIVYSLVSMAETATYIVWTIANVIAIFTDSRRRSLEDRIARSVIVRHAPDPFAEAAVPAPQPAFESGDNP